MKQPPPQVFGPTINRLADVMAHSTRYACHGVPRLAEDAGIHRTTLSRVMSGRMNPSARLVGRITTALEKALGRKLDPRELFAENALFPTPYVCDVVGCQGCLPEASTDEFGDLKASYQDVRPGEWITSRYPKGFALEKGAM